MSEKRTDLALEARESFPRGHVEVQGVILEKQHCVDGLAEVTTVKINDEAGSRAMKKPKGTYKSKLPTCSIPKSRQKSGIKLYLKVKK